ncbi:MAG: DUF1049 domain-containing protein [Xanthomonadales bacterium]|nr:DUF1049 domain-containing protein [Xanthomonadales bacterium]
MRLIRLVAAIAFLLLGGVVGALNTQPVRLDLGVVQLDASLGVLGLVLLALGMLLGAALIALGVVLPLRRRLRNQTTGAAPARQEA